MCRNASGNPPILGVSEIVEAYQTAAPFPAIITASVTTNEGIRRMALQTPLKRPIAAPTARQARIPAIVAPALPRSAACRVMMDALTMLPVAITAVMERSIWPIRSTSNWPPTRIESGSMANRMSCQAPMENIAWATPAKAASDKAHLVPAAPFEALPTALETGPPPVEPEDIAFAPDACATAVFAFHAA